MAKTQLKDYNSPRGRIVEERMNEAEMKTRRENQTAAMDDKIKELADRAIEFYDLYGAEDYRYQMMVTFLDVAFQMKDAIALISSVQVATSYLSTAIQFIDDSILYEDSFNEQLLSHSYGLSAQRKRKRMMKKAAKNNRRRLETAIKNMTARVEMAHEITESLRLGFENMRSSMARSDEKRRKKEAKQAKKKGVTIPNHDRALRYIEEVRGGKPAPAPQGNQGNAQGGGNADSDTDGIDDIL